MKWFSSELKGLKREQKGFTLIELLIVIVILGVLAAAIIPNLSKFVGSGTVGSANAELASVRTAISAFQADNNGLLPVTAGGGAAGGTINASISSYMSGTVKGVYVCDNSGLITSATLGSWPATIQWSTNNSVNNWVRTP